LPAANLVPQLPLSAASINPISAKPAGERWVGIIPGVGAKRSNRAWGPESYTALITSLLQTPNLRVLLVGGPDEKPLAQRLLADLPGHGEALQNHCGAHDILSTAALLAQCDCVIGGDTGPLHLAAAVGASIVAIYGPTSLARTGPVGNQSIHTLTPPEALACWPCELPQCPYSGEDHLACMRQVTVQDVLAAVSVQLA
jgi:heptosyltransferase-3